MAAELLGDRLDLPGRYALDAISASAATSAFSEHNDDPQPFVWAKPADQVLDKLNRLKCNHCASIRSHPSLRMAAPPALVTCATVGQVPAASGSRRPWGLVAGALCDPRHAAAVRRSWILLVIRGHRLGLARASAGALRKHFGARLTALSRCQSHGPQRRAFSNTFGPSSPSISATPLVYAPLAERSKVQLGLNPASE